LTYEDEAYRAVATLGSWLLWMMSTPSYSFA